MTRAAIVAAVALGVAAPAAGATVVTARPAADATVRSDVPRAADGHARRVTVAGGRSAVRRAYLRFRAAVPAGQTLRSATLVLYAERRGAGLAVRAAGARHWTERSLTWRTAPAPGAVTARRAKVARGRAVTLDVTDAVRRSGASVTLALTTGGARRLTFSTREAAKARRPRLVLRTTAAATAAPGLRTKPLASDTTAPGAPGGLTATGGDGAAMLAWVAPADLDVAGYRVYRQDVAGGWPATPVAAVAARSFEDRGLANGTSRAYRVTAIDGAGNESAPSAVAAATPSAAPAGAVHATAADPFVTAAGRPVRVQAINVVPVWSSRGSTWSAAKYQQIPAKGFNVVRLVLYWDDFEPQPGAFDQTTFRPSTPRSPEPRPRAGA